MPQDKYGFQEIAKTGKSNKLNTETSRNWFREQAMNVKKMSVKGFQSTATPFQNIENLSINSIGKMYSFMYDPKWKETLPYYDTFPLVFPFDFKSDRMLGINMHYLAPYARAKLMDALYETINNQKYDKTTMLKINYSILSGASQYKAFRPCIKCYLFSNVRSPFMYITPQMWDYCLMLPLARFQKKSAEYVWFQSRLQY